MTLKRKVEASRTLPPALRPARWEWFHTVGLGITVIVLGLTWLLPANAAAAAGEMVVSKDSAFYVRAFLLGFALWVGYVIRGQPVWAVIICTCISFFGAGQLVRAEYTDEVTGIVRSVGWLNLAAFVMLAWLCVRPSNHERLAEARERIRQLEGEQ